MLASLARAGRFTNDGRKSEVWGVDVVCFLKTKNENSFAVEFYVNFVPETLDARVRSRYSRYRRSVASQSWATQEFSVFQSPNNPKTHVHSSVKILRF